MGRSSKKRAVLAAEGPSASRQASTSVLRTRFLAIGVPSTPAGICSTSASTALQGPPLTGVNSMDAPM